MAKVITTNTAAASSLARRDDRSLTLSLSRLHVCRVGRRLVWCASLEQEDTVLDARTVRVAHGEAAALIRRRAGVLTLLVDRVVVQIEVRMAILVEQTLLGHRDDAFH